MVKKSETEKITLNVTPLQLGYIDLLIEQGRYMNRTEFFKDAIEKNLTANESLTQTALAQLKEATPAKDFVLGISYIPAEYIEEAYAEEKQLEIVRVGLLVVDKQVNLEHFYHVVTHLKVSGVFRGPQEIKTHYQL